MDALVKGILQGSIPTIVLVGGTHYLVKGFKVSRPVVYWGSLAVAAGLTYAVVEGKIKVPFMNAETEDAYVCPSCEADATDDYCEVCAKCLECCYCDQCSRCLADGSSECVCGDADFGAETFEARENKDGTIVLTENEWNSCRHIGHKDHYLFGNKELKLIKHLKNGVKFEVVKIHSDEVMAIIREYEDFLNKRKLRGR